MTLSVPEFVALVLAAYAAGLFTTIAVFARLARRVSPQPAEDEHAATLATFHIAVNRAMAYDRDHKWGAR